MGSEGIQKGSRHDFLLMEAFRWRQQGVIDPQDLLVKLREANDSQCKPPKREKELIKVIRRFERRPGFVPTFFDSAARIAPANGRNAPPASAGDPNGTGDFDAPREHGVTKGHRYPFLYSRGRRLHGKGITDPDELIRRLRIENQRHCNPPKGEKELANIVHRICRLPESPQPPEVAGPIAETTENMQPSGRSPWRHSQWKTGHSLRSSSSFARDFAVWESAVLEHALWQSVLCRYPGGLAGQTTTDQGAAVEPPVPKSEHPEANPEPESKRSAPPKELWIDPETGTIYPASRVHRVVFAQNALTHPEEAVYNAMWNPRCRDKDESRRSTIGYAQVARVARISYRNTPLIIKRLIRKGFVSIEKHADMFRRVPTTYRVLSYGAALEVMRRNNRQNVIRTATGVIFVERFSIDQAAPISWDPEVTLDARPASTVDAPDASTVDTREASRVDAASMRLGSLKSKLIRVILDNALTVMGDDLAEKIVTACLSKAPDLTEDELAEIAKDESMKAIRAGRKNLEDWLAKTLPARFAGASFRVYRTYKRQTQGAAIIGGSTRRQEDEE